MFVGKVLLYLKLEIWPFIWKKNNKKLFSHISRLLWHLDSSTGHIKIATWGAFYHWLHSFPVWPQPQNMILAGREPKCRSNMILNPQKPIFLHWKSVPLSSPKCLKIVMHNVSRLSFFTPTFPQECYTLRYFYFNFFPFNRNTEICHFFSKCLYTDIRLIFFQFEDRFIF